ncbi:ATP-dependent DNA helicase [Lysinibacillus boronitolerans]|uniref:ATP-dependent DNA helicase n=1 Tax=Lysinibacillus boronitolerans TaxID=309788 RepID=UPI002897245E|nr:ATP-dependent DNA helicase [Lysinibacillus boronitolerans]
MYYTKEDIDNISFEVIEKIFKKKLTSLGLSIREPQLEMANEILEMVRGKKNCLVVEAGVGTGKSFGYLVPLLTLQNHDRFGFSIIISTGTISLQEQLIKDIKFLLEKLQLQKNVVLAKGKTHFLCLDRAAKNYSNKEISDWIDYSKYGDRAELETVVPDIDNIWGNINIQNCKFRNCEYFEQCGYISLRENMKKSKSIIVTNHDQLIANAKNIANHRHPIFTTDTEIIVVDEAHNLEEKSRNALTETWSKNKINEVLKIVDNFLRRSGDYEGTKKRKIKIENLTEKLFRMLESHCEREIRKNEKMGYETQRLSLPHLNETLLKELVKELKSYNISLQLSESSINDYENVIDSIEDLINFINSISSDDNKIFWIEITNSKRILINSVQKEMNKIIYKYFFSGEKVPVILTSATISQSGESVFDQYDYLISSLGIDSLKYNQLALSKPKLSPFNYKENALLYIPPNLPHPKDTDNFRKKALSEIISLVRLTEGRTMILFTSKNDMLYVYSEFKGLNLPWKVFIQNTGSSQESIKQEFIEDENSILLSTGTFWEGIDIPGPSLSNLIIFKLPFPVPDPILEYKKSVSEDGFLEVYLPEMLIKLRQGLGRLIRKETDKGIAAILDSRISEDQNKSYRTTVLSSLPFSQVTENFQEVSDFVKDCLKL